MNIPCTITISRPSKFIGCAKQYRVELDGFVIGDLSNGATINTQTTSGCHILNFMLRGNCEKSVSLNIPENTNLIHISTSLNEFNGKIEARINCTQNLLVGDIENVSLSDIPTNKKVR